MPKVVDSSRKKECNLNGSVQLNLDNKHEMIISKSDSVSSNENYILSLSGTQHSDPEFRICAGMSDYSCVVYNIGEELTKIATLTENKSPIVGTKFSSTSKNILYIATRSGGTTVCDLRAPKGKVVAEFNDEGKLKPLASFDISCDDKLLAAGTEHVGGDAFILFWDVRFNNSKTATMTNNLLGGYWESHVDDVTSLAFHHEKQDCLSSGSTDGLINIYDLTQGSEDDALTFSLNTDSSVDRVGWLENGDIWCTTHTHELQLWHHEDATPFGKYDRASVAASLHNSEDSCYLVKIHNRPDGEPFLLTGSSTVKGEHLNALAVDSDGLRVCLDFPENKQLVRDSWYHSKSGCLITGGESSLLNIWKPAEENLLNHSLERKSQLKSNKASIRDRAKPY